MDHYFYLLLFLVVMPIIFLDDKLITYQTDDIIRDRITGMMEYGQCQADVAEVVGIELSTVLRPWQIYISPGNASRSSVEGRPRIITPSVKRFVELTGPRNRIMPVSAIAEQLMTLVDRKFGDKLNSE